MRSETNFFDERKTTVNQSENGLTSAGEQRTNNTGSLGKKSH